ncbi:hypothetical protein [Polyangium aurulentum]|uniref:hypothetical protein n=1 Tax=Polyangium aurulentum TaxID=2567896 RepID=UPI0010AE69A6|nr:hypothetical protein [Polyangium aurulentum]UQA59903.1 hypothetical protein E8A73_005265 [Polyangium aurulentum]
MIVVLASRSDEASRGLVDRWSSHGARLLLPDDLSVVGWRHGAGSVSGARAIVGGDPVPIEAIQAVLVRMACVAPVDLPHIRPDERIYVAAEMTAFLLAWLTSLPCPVYNRPTATGLMGPVFRPEQWIQVAAHCGIPVTTVRRTGAGYAAPTHPPESIKTVVVVGETCLRAPSEAARARALAVARSAGASLLDVHFQGPAADPVCVGADVWLDVGDPIIADALLALLQSGRAPAQEVGS